MVIPEGEPTPKPGDLDEDGTVGPADLGIVVAAFGTSPPSDDRADLNLDNVINILDLVRVALHFGD